MRFDGRALGFFGSRGAAEGGGVAGIASAVLRRCTRNGSSSAGIWSWAEVNFRSRVFVRACQRMHGSLIRVPGGVGELRERHPHPSPLPRDEGEGTGVYLGQYGGQALGLLRE